MNRSFFRIIVPFIFCIISIEVGKRFELWDQDWKIPLQYGIRQVYGENGGPGGLFHSLRQIPPIIEICEDINLICPDAASNRTRHTRTAP